MAKEIERQFIVNNESPAWLAIKDTLPKKRLIQTTIHKGEGNKLRVRVTEDMQTGKKDAEFAFKLSKKSKKTSPNVREEFEWEVPLRVALYIMIGHIEVKKLRYEYIHQDGKKWDIDEYEWANAGIIVADIELDTPDEKFSLPSFLWEETTKNKLITNNSFSNHPFLNWTESQRREFEKLKKRTKS